MGSGTGMCSAAVLSAGVISGSVLDTPTTQPLSSRQTAKSRINTLLIVFTP